MTMKPMAAIMAKKAIDSLIKGKNCVALYKRHIKDCLYSYAVRKGVNNGISHFIFIGTTDVAFVKMRPRTKSIIKYSDPSCIQTISDFVQRIK